MRGFSHLYDHGKHVNFDISTRNTDCWWSWGPLAPYGTYIEMALKYFHYDSRYHIQSSGHPQFFAAETYLQSDVSSVHFVEPAIMSSCLVLRPCLREFTNSGKGGESRATNHIGTRFLWCIATLNRAPLLPNYDSVSARGYSSDGRDACAFVFLLSHN